MWLILGYLGLLTGAFTLWVLTSYLSVHYNSKSIKIRKAVSRLPGLKRLPLLGNLTDVPVDQRQLTDFFTSLAVDFDGLCYLFLGPVPYLFVGKEAYAAVVVKGSSHSEKAEQYRIFHRWLGTGLLTSGGEKWKTRRKMLTPAFHFDILDRVLVKMMKHSQTAMETFSDYAVANEYFDIWHDMSLLALDIVSDAAMGVELNAQSKTGASLNYVQDREIVTEMMMDRFKSPWLWHDFTYFHILPSGRAFKKRVDSLHQFTSNVIMRRWAEIQENVEETKQMKRKSFLDLLLLAKQDHGLTFEDIREEVDTFMFEGHDTTAAAMSFVLQMLANYPEAAEKLQQEVDDMFAHVHLDEDNVQEVKKVLLSMPYLDAVLKEGLRMFPSVPSIGRTLTEDVEIDNYKLYEGTQVILHIYAIHHDPEMYKDPYRFNPDRWINKEVPIEEYPYCYVPFSAGPRNCIGQKFALLEEKLIIASIMKKFNLESDTLHKDMSVYGQVILRPVDKFQLKFSLRED